ncbi:alkaline ceramidase 3-like [Clavelina lepadiformis]|uniref:Alkaline ceramidase n=1 Tax=Clavelina lepadiformis TaxID=159417 RepID=A0ABP0H5W2_CLALP
MIYGNCVYLFILLCKRKSSKSWESMCSILLLIFGVIVTVVYLVLKNPVIFLVLYGSLVVATVYMTALVCKMAPSLRRIALVLHLIYLFGFVVWNIDIHFCSSLRSFRSQGEVWNKHIFHMTQLHAWWHILAGYASFLQLYFAIRSRCMYLGKSFRVKKFMEIWPYLEFP